MMTQSSRGGASVRICVDGTEAGRLSGRVYSRFVSEPLFFPDAGNLVLEIDEILDAQKFPQAFERTRTFVSREASLSAAVSGPESGLSEEVIAAARGGKATFVVSVLSRRNSTWQGTVDWLDGAPPRSFASGLEFLRLISERVF